MANDRPAEQEGVRASRLNTRKTGNSAMGENSRGRPATRRTTGLTGSHDVTCCPALQERVRRRRAARAAHARRWKEWEQTMAKHYDQQAADWVCSTCGLC